VLPIAAELRGEGVTVVGGPARIQLGQLEGRAAGRFSRGNDGTPDRVLATWVVRGSSGSRLTVIITHERAGSVSVELTLPGVSVELTLPA
jgi:hypothetical protein